MMDGAEGQVAWRATGHKAAERDGMMEWMKSDGPDRVQTDQMRGFVDVTPEGAWWISSWTGCTQRQEKRGSMGSNES